MRLKTDTKPKDATFQVVLDALALTPFYQAFLITAEVPAIYMKEFWAIVSVHKSSIRFRINKKKFSLDVEIFREILQICPKIPGQEFEDLPLEHDILSFIRDLGHSRDIIYLIDVSVDYLHQPWREFATIINKCLSGKETGMDKIRLSHAQILWGMFYKKNIDYVYLLWEDLLFQIKNKEAKNTNKMSYPRFTKIIVDYFMSKDQSNLRRNNMFWHNARDYTMFTSMRYISRHEDTQVYGSILPKELTNQAILESNAYKTYYAFASGEKTPKPKFLMSNISRRLVQMKELVLYKEVPGVPMYESESEKESRGDSEDEDEDEDDENNSDDISDEGDDDNDGNNGNDGDDDNANDGDKQEGDDMNDNDEETDSDRTESDRIKIPILDQSTTEYYEE
ncbi:hypothetical protein Tco_0040343 [Tanacetum coccineum]